MSQGQNITHQRELNLGAQSQEPVVTRLKGSEIEDWAWQRGKFAQSSGTHHEGGFRLLFAQAESSYRATTPESLSSGSVLDALGLPSCTLASFQLPHGTFSTHYTPVGSDLDTCSKLSTPVVRKQAVTQLKPQ